MFMIKSDNDLKMSTDFLKSWKLLFLFYKKTSVSIHCIIIYNKLIISNNLYVSSIIINVVIYLFSLIKKIL